MSQRAGHRRPSGFVRAHHLLSKSAGPTAVGWDNPPYLRWAPPAWAPHSGVEVIGGAWSWGQVTPGYSRRTTLWFEGGDVTALKVLSKNDTSGVEPVERPSHGPPRGTRGVPLGWSSPPPRVVNRSLQGGESEPPGTRAGASGCQAGPSSILVAAESRPFAAPGCARPPPRYLAAALSCSRPPRSIDAPAPSSGTAPSSIDTPALDPKMHR